MVNALWKIHKVEFIYTNKETHKVQLGPSFSPTEDYICVSMYLLMCDYCKVKLTLLDASNVEVIEQDFNQLVSSEWREIKFISESKRYQHNKFKLLVSTIGGTRDQRFWAIDRVRLCQKEEFRMISLTKKETCQLMSSDNKIITLRDSLQVSESECPENTIGEFCVPCEWIYENCELIKICDNDKCVCSSGYTIENKHCYFTCDSGSYGHGCKKSCGKCSFDDYYFCNTIDGTCSSCTDGFSGPRCDIPPSIIFARPPDVTNVKYTEAIVHVTDFTLNNTSYNETPSAYTIQYKIATNKNSKWITHNSNYTLNENHSILINNLKADTKYFVRGVIITNNGNAQVGSHLKFKEFTTNCQEIPVDNIEIKSTNTTAFVSLKTPKKQFQTTEGVPQQVFNLRVANRSSSTIFIKWEKPASINGVFKHYIVKYRPFFLSCKQPTNRSAEHTLNVTETSITIKDLLSCSIYKFTVFAENTKLKGLPLQLSVGTLPEVTVFPSMPMLNIVKQYTPNTRDSYSKTSILELDTEKYRVLRNEVNAMMSTFEIKEIILVQICYTYGQFLIRTAYSSKSQNRNESVVDAVLCYGEQLESRQGGREYNLDPRRYGMGLSALSLNKKLDCRRIKSGTGEADGLPSPLSPTHKLRTAAPVAHRTWDWAVCRNALWVNRLWSAIYPFHSWGLDRSLPRSLLARRQERCYTAHRSPVPGGPLRCVTRIGPPKGTLTSSARVPLASPVQIIRQLRGAVCSLNLWGPKTRTPSTFRGRLTPARRPRSRPLPQAIAITTSCPLSLSFTLPGHYFGELSAPLVQKWVT
ncbi:hypothetical protein MTP99_000011 [Tenebrio molitor]|nr:hypothetical protein MTP99_000011 [Tenebrio molitor]